MYAHQSFFWKSVCVIKNMNNNPKCEIYNNGSRERCRGDGRRNDEKDNRTEEEEEGGRSSTRGGEKMEEGERRIKEEEERYVLSNRYYTAFFSCPSF